MNTFETTARHLAANPSVRKRIEAELLWDFVCSLPKEDRDLQRVAEALVVQGTVGEDDLSEKLQLSMDCVERLLQTLYRRLLEWLCAGLESGSATLELPNVMSLRSLQELEFALMFNMDEEALTATEDEVECSLAADEDAEDPAPKPRPLAAVAGEAIRAAADKLIAIISLGELSPLTLAAEPTLSSSETIAVKQEQSGVARLDKIFGAHTLETHLPWASPELQIVQAPSATEPSRMFFEAIIGTRPTEARKYGVLDLVISAPDGSQAQVDLEANRLSGIFEGDLQLSDWHGYALQIQITPGEAHQLQDHLDKHMDIRTV